MTGKVFVARTIWIAALVLGVFALGAPLANTAYAQGSRKDDVVFNAQGRPMAGATVRVCAAGATGEPCSPLASIYSDAALTQALANPLATDGLGNYTFYAAAGRYTIEVSGPGITAKQMPNVILPSDPSSPTFTTVTTTSGISAFSLSLTGNLTVTGSAAVVGSLSVGGAPVPSTGVDNQWSASQRFKGPVPNRDLSAYMRDPSGNSVNCADSVNVATEPMSTMTIGNGSTTATVVSTAATYKAGCGLSISGAGPTSTVKFPTGASGVSCVRTSGNLVTCTLPAGHNLESGFVNIGNDNPIVVSGCSDATMNTAGTQINTVPSSTTVTYSDGGSNGTGTGCTVSFLIAYAHGQTGALTYYYKLAAIDNLDGVSPAVGPVTITNGAGTAGSGSAADNFTRANGGLGANWTTLTDFFAPTISGNKILGNNSGNHQAAFYNAASLSSGQDNKITYGGTSTSNSDAGAGVWARASGGQGYLCLAFTGNIALYKVSLGPGFTNLAEAFGASLSSGDTLEITAVGQILTCLKNGTPILTASDSSYTSGAAGVHVYGASSSSAITNFQATGISSPGIGRQADGFFDYNWIGWPYTGNARMFAVWRSMDNSTYALVGCPQTIDWSDWGYSAPCPSWVPATPPNTNRPQSLKTTITAVNGSTITVANAATNSVTAAPAYHDETTFLTQCLTDQKAGQGAGNGQQGAESYCLIPPTAAGSAYYFNSDLPWDTLSTNGGAHVEVAGTMYMNTWPWHFSKGGYYVHGMSANTAPSNFGTFPATQVYFGKNVPAAFVFTANAPNGIGNLAAEGLQGYGLMTGVDPTGSGGGGTVCFDDLYLVENANATGVPMRFGSNTIGVNSCLQGGSAAQNINLQPRPDGFPASIIVGTDSYGGNGTFGINIGYSQFLYHGVYADSPGGLVGGGSTGNIAVGPVLSEDHGVWPTGGIVHIDSGNNDGGTGCGGPCALPYGTNVPVVGGVSVTISNADASSKVAYTVSGMNNNNSGHFVSGDNVWEGPVCVHGSPVCGRGAGVTESGALPGPSHYYIAPPGNDFAVTQDHKELLTGFGLEMMGSGITATVFPAVMIAPAQSAVATCSTSGGSLADGAYYFKVVREDNEPTPGTTIPSPEGGCTISGSGGHGSVSLAWTILPANAAKDARVYYGTQPCDEYGCYENAYAVVSENESAINQSTTISTVSGWTSDSIMNHTSPTATLWNWNCMFCYAPAADVLSYGYKLYGPGVPSLPSGSSVGFLDLNLKPGTAAALPACNSGAEGSMQAITDSTTATWGATVAGSGTNHVLAYCDGTNWTVAAK